MREYHIKPSLSDDEVAQRVMHGIQVLKSSGYEEIFASNSKACLASTNGDLTDCLEGWLGLFEVFLDRVEEVEVDKLQ